MIYTSVGVTSAYVFEQGLNFRRSSSQKQSVQCRLFRNVVLRPSAPSSSENIAAVTGRMHRQKYKIFSKPKRFCTNYFRLKSKLRRWKVEGGGRIPQALEHPWVSTELTLTKVPCGREEGAVSSGGKCRLAGTEVPLRRGRCARAN